MNGVRRIPGVNVTEIDTSERIVTQCKEDGKWSPNVWYDHSTTAVASTTLMHIYCTREYKPQPPILLQPPMPPQPPNLG